MTTWKTRLARWLQIGFIPLVPVPAVARKSHRLTEYNEKQVASSSTKLPGKSPPRLFPITIYIIHHKFFSIDITTLEVLRNLPPSGTPLLFPSCPEAQPEPSIPETSQRERDPLLVELVPHVKGS